MLLRQPLNEGVVRYLDRHACNNPPDFQPPPEKNQEAGSHPDVVERIWDQLGASLPVECRQVVLGSPALIHNKSGVVLALAIGTQYGIRVPRRVLQEGKANPRTEVLWGSGGTMDIRAEFGEDWAFGTWASVEEAWLLEAYREREKS